VTSPRRALAVLAACVVVAVACTRDEPAPGPPAGAPAVEDMARALGRDVVGSLHRGYVPNRSGEILLVPEPWTVVGRWGREIRGPDDPRTSHATPWAYHQRVPIILYGPGYVRSGVRPDRPVDVTDIAPTLGSVIGSSFVAPDGEVLGEALRPDRVPAPPGVAVVIALDGVGWNVLERWPEEWPVLRRLALEGTTYTNATIGSAPPLTAPIHANMGTGAYPRTHGMPEIVGRLPDGSIDEVYLSEGDPSLLEAETLADAWDRQTGGRAWAGLVGFETWHLGMLGHGAQLEGADHDVAVLWDRDDLEFWVNEDFYELPDYLPSTEVLGERLRELDRSDGALDGLWRGHDLADGAIIPGTPAFVEYTGAALLDLVEREAIGRDEVTDLLFVELKAADFGGHVWNMDGEETAAVLRAQDRVIGDLLAAIEARVGSDGYVAVVTADHGQTPNPFTTGGLRVDRDEVGRDVDRYFGRPIVQEDSPDDLYLDVEAMREAGITLEDVARFLGDYRYRDGAAPGTDLSELPGEILERRVFAAALPGPFVGRLTPEEIEALGPGVYPEGDLITPPRIRSLGQTLR
jgi:predicted AlkP superfamily pyrophosphatase or phosphodiesterase